VCRPTAENASSSQESAGDGPMAKKHAGDKKSLDKKKKDKKKVLKRL
jgi:ubiquitin-conjugating enzyme E2 S